MAHMPTLPEERLAGAYLYYDAAADDARLTLTLARTAALDHGAVVANHTEVVGLLHDADGRVTRRHRGGRRRAASRCAARRGRQRHRRVGRRGARPRRGRRPRLDPPGQGHPHHGAVGQGAQRHRRRGAGAQGQALGLRRAVAAHGDGTFELTYIGTTDTDYDGPDRRPAVHAPTTSPTCSRPSTSPSANRSTDGRRRRHLGRAAAAREGGHDGRTADLSRRHKVHRHATAASSSITGGKLTTYREMAEDTVDAVVEHLGDAAALGPPVPHPALAAARRQASTRRRRLDARHLADRYGSEARVVEALIDADPSLGAPLVDGSPLPAGRGASTPCATRWPRTVDDVLARRTRARLQARDASRRRGARRRRADGRRARLVRRRGRSARSPPTSRSSRPSATAPRLPLTDLVP